MEAVIVETAAAENRVWQADFGAWMAREHRRIYLLCLRMLRNSDDADSITQDVFVKAYRALAGSNKEVIESPSKWLTRVAVNACLDRLRSKRWLFWQKRPSPQDEQTILQLTPAGGPNQEEVLLAREISRRLGTALGKLSLRQRAVFVLRHDEDRKLEEIASILRIDLGTVKAHMARAVRKLRAELRDLYGTQTLER